MSLPGDMEECMAPAAKRRILDTEAVGKENGSQDLQVSQEAEAAQTLFEMTNWRETGDQHPKEGTSEGHEGNTMPHTPEKGVTKDHNNVRQPRRSSERRDTRVNPRGTMPKCPKELKTGENHSKLSQHRKTDIAISKDQNLERGDSDEEPSALSPLSSDSDHHSHSEGDECCIVSVGTQPSNTERSLKALESVQQELKAVNERADRAFLQLKRRYGHLRRPHIQKRSAIISTIPGFWVTAFLSHPQMSAMIDDRDEDTLSYMNNLQVEDFTHMKSSCKIEFYFNRNPYFKNEVLIKEFQYNSSGRLVSRSTPIRWLQGQKPRGEDKSSPSFFSWFSDHSFPSADRIATIIKEDLWPNPLEYYYSGEGDSDDNSVEDSDSDNVDDCVVIVDDDEDGEDGEDDDEENDVHEISDNTERQTEGTDGDEEDEDEDEEVVEEESGHEDIVESNTEEHESGNIVLDHSGQSSGNDDELTH